MTSLTPHRDAAERVVADMEATLGCKFPAAAPQAVNVRVIIATTAAITRALADELDRGVSGRAVTNAAVNAIGNAIVTVAASACGEERGPKAILTINALLLQISRHISDVVGDTDETKYSRAPVDKRAGHA